jgi:hypothetical protein
MQLTRHTDYALRLLIYLAGQGERRASIAEVAADQEISRTHLMKITKPWFTRASFRPRAAAAAASSWRERRRTSILARRYGPWSLDARLSTVPAAG